MVQHDWQKGRIVRIEDETASTKRFWIEMPEITRFDFVPGQFITLELPIHEQQSKRARSYSIASAPDGTNVVEQGFTIFPENISYNLINIGTGSIPVSAIRPAKTEI